MLRRIKREANGTTWWFCDTCGAIANLLAATQDGILVKDIISPLCLPWHSQRKKIKDCLNAKSNQI